MRIFFLAIRSIIFISVAFLLFTPYVHSQDVMYEFNGVIYEQPSYFFLDDNNLINPDNDILKFSDWTNRFYGRINLNFYYKDIKFISQTRPTYFLEQDNDDLDFFTDDAYLDLGLRENYFFYIGKRNLRDVVAYGENPTDFMGENKEVDFTKREEERRVEREGNYVVGAEAFLKNITLSAAYAPHIDDEQEENDRLLLRGNFFAESINTDMSLHFFEGDIPGVGFDISSTVSDNLVLHTENAFRWGSKRKEITLLNACSCTTLRTYDVTDPDDEKVYPHIVVGGSYTFGDGTNVILEYVYNGDGYNDSEWDEIFEFISYHEDEYRNGSEQLKGAATGILATDATDIFQVREMRKNYIFFRLSNSTLIQNVDGQLVFILNADDMSFLTFPSIDYKARDNFVVGLSATLYTGDDDSEFGMMFWNSEVSLLLKYYFSL